MRVKDLAQKLSDFETRLQTVEGNLEWRRHQSIEFVRGIHAEYVEELAEAQSVIRSLSDQLDHARALIVTQRYPGFRYHIDGGSVVVKHAAHEKRLCRGRGLWFMSPTDAAAAKAARPATRRRRS